MMEYTYRDCRVRFQKYLNNSLNHVHRLTLQVRLTILFSENNILCVPQSYRKKNTIGDNAVKVRKTSYTSMSETVELSLTEKVVAFSFSARSST